MKLIRDAVHGNIELEDKDVRILDTPEMQRLRFVRQLAAAYLVYPSATHTRFEHCLGAYHLTRQLSAKLNLEKDEAKLAQWSALLHDVGHGAFSHASDPVLEEQGLGDHEKRGIELIKKSEIGDEIKKAGFSVEDVRKRMAGHASGVLVEWDLGTDRIDYLLRDGHFTGAHYSLVDAQRLLDTVVYKGGKVFVQEKGSISAESLLVSRYFMFTVVYYHPAARISEQMIHAMFRQAFRDNSLTPEEVANGADAPILFKLAKEGSSMAARLMNRKLFKKAFVQNIDHADKDVQEFFAKKDAWKKTWKVLEDAGFSEEEAVVCPPALIAKPVTCSILETDGSEYSLAKESAVVRALNEEGKKTDFIVACDVERKAKAEKAVKQFLSSL